MCLVYYYKYLTLPPFNPPLPTRRTKKKHWTLSSICKSASKAVHSRMQLVLHATTPTLHGASPSTSAWSVKTPRAPSWHCKDASIYGRTTTAMQDKSTPPPLLSTPGGSDPRKPQVAKYQPIQKCGHVSTRGLPLEKPVLMMVPSALFYG